MQVQMIHNGLPIPSEFSKGSFLVNEYLVRKNLAEIGYRFDGNDLDDFTMKAFNYISNEFIKASNKQLMKNTKGARRGK